MQPALRAVKKSILDAGVVLLEQRVGGAARRARQLRGD
jgi:hypothetical protein